MVYIFTFKNQPNAPDSLLPVLYKVSQEWREKYQTNPSFVGSFAEGDHPAVPLDGAPAATSATRGCRRRGGAEGDQGGRMAVGGREMGASGVESCGGQAGHGRGSGHHDTGRGHGAHSANASIACSAGDPVEVCGDATARSGDEWTSNFIHLRAVTAAPGGGSNVHNDGEAGGQCYVAPGWLEDSVIERTDFRACGPDTRKALQSVLRLVFREHRQHLLHELLLCCNFVGHHS